MKKTNHRNTTSKKQTGGLDPLLKLPDSLYNTNYDNITVTDDTVSIKDPGLPVFRDKDKPFILNEKRRNWIAQFYPYSPYFVDIVKNIKWDRFTIDLDVKGIRIPGLVFEVKLGYSRSYPPCVFFGGSAIELYNREMAILPSVSLTDYPRLHDYVAPTADIDIGLNFFLFIRGAKAPLYPFSEDGRDIIDQVNFDAIRELIFEELHAFIEEEINKKIKLLLTHLNKSKSKSASRTRTIFNQLLRSIRSKRLSRSRSKSKRGEITMELIREDDRFRIMANIDGEYSDHLMEFIPDIKCVIGEDEEETWFDFEDMLRHKGRSRPIRREYNSNYHTTVNGYCLFGMDRLLEKNTQMVRCANTKLFGNERRLPDKFYDKSLCLLNRIRYMLLLISHLYRTGNADVLGKTFSETIIDVYITFCKEKESKKPGTCPQFYVDLKNDESRTFYRSFSALEIPDV